jgi:hypothetical protein
MKKVISIALLVSIIVLSFSCKKDSDSTPSNPSFSAKVQGTLWTGSSMVASHATAQNYTQVSAMGTLASEQISFDFIGSGTGTFPINDTNIGMVAISNYNFTSLFCDSPEGTITITKYDAVGLKISGTFSFKGEDIYGSVYHLTEGKFENITLVVN